MFQRWIMTFVAAVAITGFALVNQAISQEAPPPPSDNATGSTNNDRGGDRGNRDPEQMRQRMEQFRQQAAERLKTALGVTDDEWKVLQPKIEKVTQLSMQVRVGGMMGMMGRRGNRIPRPDSNSSATSNEVQQKLQALQTLLENKDASPNEIKAAVTSYRDARTKAKDELQKAQKELQELLTVRQEAQLVAYGLLE